MTESTFQEDRALRVGGYPISSILIVCGQVLRRAFISYDVPLYTGQNEVVA